MKRKLLLLVLSSLLLSGCNVLDNLKPKDSSSNSNTTSFTSSSISSSKDDSSSPTSPTSSSEPETPDPGEVPDDDVTDLGVMTIAQVREYIASHKPELNSHEVGVDYKHKVTIKAFALDRFDLVKAKAAFGLDVSYHAKVMMGDATGAIACASNAGDGKTLFGKVDSHAGEDTSRYEVTGYLSIYLGQPELCVPNNSKEYTWFTWNSSLDITKNPSAYVKESINLEQFYNLEKGLKYNCAGHGYGDYYRINGLTCIYSDASSGFYYMSDGNRYIKVIKNNISLSVGGVYDIIGYLSTKDYQPALSALAQYNSETPAYSYDASKRESITASSLRNNKTSQEDTDQRFDNFILSFSKLYKATVYMGLVTENSKYYVCFHDEYKGDSPLTGKDQQGANGAIFIDNNIFWNVSASALEQYNPYYASYIMENTTVELTFMLESIRYSSKKPIWKVILLPETIPSM